jgi:hypothetical protein
LGQDTIPGGSNGYVVLKQTIDYCHVLLLRRVIVPSRRILTISILGKGKPMKCGEQDASALLLLTVFF